MSRNIEIKAELSSQQRQSAIAAAKKLTGKQPTVIYQKDTFFCVPVNRLKLRQFEGERAELIAYARENCEHPVPSSYYRIPVDEPDQLLAGLSLVLGVRGTVEKTRQLYLLEQTRIHIDEVTRLGDYLELEVVLRDDQSEAEGVSIANQLMQQLGIKSSQLVSSAYIDLLEQQTVASSE